MIVECDRRLRGLAAHTHRELSPRCLSRDSSGLPRCPSSESAYSGRGLQGLLPGALPPLPPPAAMAAYLGAAAAAAHQAHRRLLVSPLAAVSPLLTASGSPPPPPLLPLLHGRLPASPSPSPSPQDDSDVLDFSTKRSNDKSEDAELDAVNLSKPSENSPLDLSVTSRKRGPEDSLTPPPARKSSRPLDYKPVVSPWTSPVASHLPYFAAAVAAASLSPKNNNASDWNGKLKHMVPTPSDATKALEKMSELSRLGGEELFRSVAQSAALGTNLPGTAAGRHSAWQSHWLNKGAEQAKDVLKCVWCKKSFPTLADMTIHMKEAKHCGVNVPVPPSQAPNLPPPQLQPPTSSPSASHNSSGGSGKPSQNDLNLLIKETMPLPRKLVRGQDVWLGKGAEQTRQILKCMWCGQSFRSLAEMTSHMQQTQHYTNIISQEQIISWKSSDESKGATGPTGNSNTGAAATGTSSHVSAVLTCKVCDQAFSSLKELSNHMVKNSHYKEHIMRSITESGGRRRQTREKRKKSLPVRKLLELERAQHEFKNGDGVGLGPVKPMRDLSASSRITCEKCGDKIETAVFVEHIRQCVGGPITNSQRNLLKNALMSNNILPPENSLMVGHLTPSNREGRKSINDDMPSPGSRHHRSPSSVTDLSPNPKDSGGGGGSGGAEKSSSPSVLNAIEQLIEKSFDSRSRHGSIPGIPGAASHAPIGSSILKRLGIDESVDYTKPLVDAQTMNILRNYHHHQQVQVQNFARRERSGSESSSMSERGSSRVESLTPDRKMDPPSYHMTPRTTPDTKRGQTPLSDRVNSHDDQPGEVRIKKEIPDEDEREDGMNLTKGVIHIKKEIEDEDENRTSRPESRHAAEAEEGRLPTNLIKRRDSSASPRPRPSPQSGTNQHSPSRNSTSPASDRSATPRSTPGADRKPSGSLGALSSMFDSLSGGSGTNENASGSSKRGSSHPLAALQKLCDKTENHHPNHRNAQSTGGNTSSGSAPSPAASTGPTPGAILAFSWACNDAVMTADSIMKCAFCDTPFISKGAYRHHLSKMHFVKDGVIPDPVALKATQQSGASAISPSNKNNVSSSSVNNSSSSSSALPTDPRSPPQPSNFEESPHSKFLKYTELAKQLSSKYV
ncbi:protein tiptop-like isoform X2 [Arctopsyche grandis]|uniref:protein tiptop-like isoform X2 n=1 Tax=Arctopsyche grandis TaxID=121162 RepID=UPI00406D71EC